MAKTAVNRKKAAQEFADRWHGKGYEKGESQLFWIDLLQHVYNVENITDFIIFEDKVHLDHTSFIDAWIPSTHVMIEQKSCGKNLRRPIKQSDSSFLTPFQQAKRYSSELPYSSRPRWIVTCNFQEFLIYDMEKPQGEPEQILLEDLPDKFEYMQFLVNPEKNKIDIEAEVSLKAGELVGKLYDAILKQYKNPESAETLKSLNILCVRLVFLLYAEDAGIFPEKDMFGRYLAKSHPDEAREKILNLFEILNTKPENRDPYLSDDLAAFPYVNGGLFAGREIEIPRFNAEIFDILVNKASAGFDWSEISPTIFGAVFESTLNPETRRKGGMHYTSVENIHKVIDPLFLDDLRAEFSQIVEPFSETAHKPQNTIFAKETFRETSLRKRKKLEQFQNKIASLKFLDPACGSGNFLTETYISLRRLENEILKIIHGTQQFVGRGASPIKVKISQFYGIEINDFAVTVAKTALWIAESQMMKETEEIVDEDLDFLPLSTSATIVEGNALRMDWRYLQEEENIPTITAKRTNLIYPAEVHEREEKYEAINLITDEINIGKPKQKKTENHYDYIMGNPPFVGYSYQSKEQKNDIFAACCNKNGVVYKGVGKIDYVAGWYFKTAGIIQGTDTKAAFVSTNSITQGEQVTALWKPLFGDYNIKIDFAWRTFRWANETSDKKNMAAVHCVIIGFSATESSEPKIIFLNELEKIEAKNINGYLLDAPSIWVGSRPKSLCDVPVMLNGGKPAEGGNLILTEEEKNVLLTKNPLAEKFLRPYMMGKDFIDRKTRWCLWLVGANPSDLRKCPEILKRIEAVRKSRLESRKMATQKKAETPTLFDEVRECITDYVAIPKVSSEQRRYIPIEYLSKDVIAGDKLFMIPQATLYHFGVLTSSVHMVWMRAVCGRLKSDYSYSNTIVYNNFPWPDAAASYRDFDTPHRNSGISKCRNIDKKEAAARIEKAAQHILDIRAKYPDSSLADLYDETTMPPDLRKAHKENDKAVLAAYGFSPKMSEAEIVAELFKMYEKLTEKR